MLMLLSIPSPLSPPQWWGAVAVLASVGAGVALWALLWLRPHPLPAGACPGEPQDRTLPLLAPTVCTDTCHMCVYISTCVHMSKKGKEKEWDRDCMFVETVKSWVVSLLTLAVLLPSTGQRSTCQLFQSSLPSSWKLTVEAASLILRF